MKTFSAIITAAVFALGLTADTFATGDEAIEVSGGGVNLQSAIENATDGATLKVYPGTYSPIRTYNKRITIKSVNGPTETIIDANGHSRCANLTETPKHAINSDYAELQLAETNTVLIGFTIVNGNATAGDEDIMTGPNGAGCGGGVAGGTIKNCIVKELSCVLWRRHLPL